jgi:broad specificity phosphatase PhoE
LTPEGRAAAAKLADLNVAALYVSPLRRARETAAFIPGDPIILPDLAEIHFGEWEGLSWQEIEARWPGVACRKVEDWLGVTAPGGECWTDFCARIDRALAIILAGPRPAAVVAHWVVNSAITHRLLSRDPKTFRQQYGEILTCDA